MRVSSQSGEFCNELLGRLRRVERIDDIGALVRCADPTDGCLTVHQIREFGYTTKEIRALVRRGLLRRVFRGVYVVATVRLSHQQVIRCALLAAGPSSHVAARTAFEIRRAAQPHRGGHFWIGVVGGQRRPIRRTQVALDSTGRVAIVHFIRVSGTVTTEMVHGVPVAAVGHALVDVAARESASMARRIVREADYLGLLDEEDLGTAFDRGRKGTRAARAVLPRGPLVTALAGGPDSRAAYRLIRALIERGYPPTSVNRPMRLEGQEFRPDSYYAKYDVVLEADGPQHRREERRERDQARDAVFSRAGIETVRVETERIRRHLTSAVDEVVAVFTRRALE